MSNFGRAVFLPDEEAAPSKAEVQIHVRPSDEAAVVYLPAANRRRAWEGPAEQERMRQGVGVAGISRPAE